MRWLLEAPQVLPTRRRGCLSFKLIGIYQNILSFILEGCRFCSEVKTIYLFFSTFSKVWGTPSVISGGTHAEVVVASQDEVIWFSLVSKTLIKRRSICCCWC